MSQLKMSELRSTIDRKNLMRLEIYDSVLVKCHKRIQYNSDLEKTYCFFQIPEFIIGVPIYNINEMKKYIMNSLKNNGFQLLYIDPNWLFIHWGHHAMNQLANTTLKKEIKKKEKDNSYRSVDNYKPEGLIYDESTILGLSNKLI
tara:strand:+ start:1773 stop:2207 length:435 start_codon:yes stop_codon:yes gene_type:complete